MSQNLHAELLLRAVAHEKKGFGVTDAGLRVEQEFLKSIGVAEGISSLSDGSGLARDDLVTPRATVQLLRFDEKQPWGADYISTFPVAGSDGTLDSRMLGTAAAGHIFAKTGGLDHVRALSGFATTTGGEHLVFSMFGNNNPQHGRDSAVADGCHCGTRWSKHSEPTHATRTAEKEKITSGPRTRACVSAARRCLRIAKTATIIQSIVQLSPRLPCRAAPNSH